MALYSYLKARPAKLKHNKTRSPRALLFSLIFIFAGGGILLWITWPILSFLAFTAPSLSKTVSPISIREVALYAANSIYDHSVDYSNPNMWYPSRPQMKLTNSINHYSISIPKLKIIDAIVKVAGDDLNKSLIHYGGTSMPGEMGNTVIFGHSTLVQLFNPKDYKTIFATLPNMKKGDEFSINYDGILYTYQVEDMTVTDPTDFSPLENIPSASYVTLITCVPPGTYFKRLNIRGKLQKI